MEHNGKTAQFSENRRWWHRQDGTAEVAECGAKADGWAESDGRKIGNRKTISSNSVSRMNRSATNESGCDGTCSQAARQTTASPKTKFGSSESPAFQSKWLKRNVICVWHRCSDGGCITVIACFSLAFIWHMSMWRCQLPIVIWNGTGIRRHYTLMTALTEHNRKQCCVPIVFRRPCRLARAHGICLDSFLAVL